MKCLGMVVHQGHMEYGQVVKREKIYFADTVGAAAQMELVHERNQMEAHQILAVERCIVEIAPSLVIRINVKQEFRKLGQESLGDGQITFDDCSSESLWRVLHDSECTPSLEYIGATSGRAEKGKSEGSLVYFTRSITV